MDLAVFRALLTPSGQAVLQEALALEPREVDFLGHFTSLRRRYPEALARAALEIAILRREATSKFPFAERMYFTRPALEQATDYRVSTYRAQRFRPYERLVDLGCSIGGDTLPLAVLAPTLGVDLDPLRLVMAQANLAALGLEQHVGFIQADLTSVLPTSKSTKTGLFFDPARRAGGRRIYSVRDYQPPLEKVQEWRVHHPALGVKISPGVKLDELNAYQGEIEFISLHGDLKEAVLWFGPLMTAHRRATVLPGPYTMVAEPVPGNRTALPPDLPLSEPRAYLYEPDASVLRAGLVKTLGQQLGAAQMDPDIAYLTADRLVATPFGRAWQVEDWFPFGLKRLRAALRERNVGQVVVKKRGSPLQPEALIHDLRLSGDQQRLIFLTHLRGRPIVVLALPETLDVRGELTKP